jgi:hypothetical protein
MFGMASPVMHTMTGLLTGKTQLVHAYGLPSARRQAFQAALAFGFLEQERGVQVLDTGDLASRHYDRENSIWPAVERAREPVVLSMGREMEVRLGMYYFRALLERAVSYALPFVVITDYTIEVHTPRYADLQAVMSSSQFDCTNLDIGVVA